MMPALGDQQTLFARAVNEAMLRIDASRPPAPQLAAQRLRFTDALERPAAGVLDEQIDPRQDLSISRLPVEIVFSGAFVEDQFHSESSRASPLPSSSSRTASRSRSAFCGFLGDWAVSY